MIQFQHRPLLFVFRLIGLDKLGSPLGAWGLWLSPFLKCSIDHCMYGNFRPFSRICFCRSPPCNTTTQEQQRVKLHLSSASAPELQTLFTPLVQTPNPLVQKFEARPIITLFNSTELFVTFFV